MLITLSGMVGSGKSTASKRVVELLEGAGIECRYLRFRSLGLFGFRARPPGHFAARKGTASPDGPRWTGFQPRTLSARVACGYAARIIAFRLFAPPTSTRTCNVLDRFFYDSFVHYKLNTRPERFYAAVLRRIMPAPDLAILLVASSETITERRPEYDADYVSVAGRGYERLRTQFPELVAVCTDSGQRSLERLDALVHDQLRKSGLSTRSNGRREAI